MSLSLMDYLVCCCVRFEREQCQPETDHCEHHRLWRSDQQREQVIVMEIVCTHTNPQTHTHTHTPLDEVLMCGCSCEHLKVLLYLFSFKPIVEYIDNQFEIYLQEELKIKRNLVETHDTRIHICLYFINPTGHS